MAKQRVVITGGAGFLGSHLCERFLAEGWEVICMDNLITGDLRNIEHLSARSDFHFYHQDVTEFVHVSGPVDAVLRYMGIRKLKGAALGFPSLSMVDTMAVHRGESTS